jgi:quercetin dioxygenase-like cupin family protein
VSKHPNGHAREHSDCVLLYALQALPTGETSATEAHLAECSPCRREIEALRPVVDSFVHWPRAILRPTAPLWERLAARLAIETRVAATTAPEDNWQEPEWKEAAPGLWYQLLSKDSDTHRVTMLVRLEPGAEYPSHFHAGVEELHLLDGELRIDDRKLHAGDYNRAGAGTGDTRVWSETGCACVLITSHRDILK